MSASENISSGNQSKSAKSLNIDSKPVLGEWAENRPKLGDYFKDR